MLCGWLQRRNYILCVNKLDKQVLWVKKISSEQCHLEVSYKQQFVRCFVQTTIGSIFFMFPVSVKTFHNKLKKLAAISVSSKPGSVEKYNSRSYVCQYWHQSDKWKCQWDIHWVQTWREIHSLFLWITVQKRGQQHGLIRAEKASQVWSLCIVFLTSRNFSLFVFWQKNPPNPTYPPLNAKLDKKNKVSLSCLVKDPDKYN